LKILFLTRSLETGGAERQLTLMACGLAARGHDVAVATFYNKGGTFEAELTAAGVNVCSLDKRGRRDTLPFFGRLRRLTNTLGIEVIYTFLGTPNIIGAFLKLSGVRARLIWSIRASNTNLKIYGTASRLSYAVERRLSVVPDAIIANSHAGSLYSASKGFPASKITVVPNGIDTEHFSPARASGEPVRREWGVEPHQRLIGLVGRLDPVKDHPGFLDAAARLTTTHPDARFVCVGDGPKAYNVSLREHAARLGLAERVIWAGERADMASVYNAFDVATLISSFGEGFPNVLGEAMACGVPCVATDVGDCAWVVGESGETVAPGDPVSVAAAWGRLLDSNLSLRGHQARERALQAFSLDRAVVETEALLVPGSRP
jgi:glycosyltransferase involved in cell wall biosynthesis